MSSRRRMSPEQRREALLDTGEELFGSSGRFEDLSMDDIATAAGVTRRLLYHYFPTKAHFSVPYGNAPTADCARTQPPHPPTRCATASPRHSIRT